MRNTFARHRHWILSAALLGALLLPAGARAQAVIDTTWDHYKVYLVSPTGPAGIPIVLSDQFVQNASHNVFLLDRFANPTEKRVPGQQPALIHDPRLHYMWWRITDHPWDANVVAINQFGDQALRVLRPLYLLNPAVKNEQPGPPLPVSNHYKCYDCVGQPVNKSVTLIDQFGQWQANVTLPRLFCNPVKKTVPATGQTFDIIDPRQHYVCYEFDPEDPRIFSASIRDQFTGPNQRELGPSKLLCVPTHKDRVTSVEPGTWGRLKLLHR